MRAVLAQLQHNCILHRTSFHARQTLHALQITHIFRDRFNIHRARGDRSKEVAVQLGISERTVKAHLGNIYSKLGVDSRAAAIAIAAQKGMLGER